MPTDNYLEDLAQRLLDPEYANAYIQTAISETLEDGYIDGLLLALRDVVEAKRRRPGAPSKQDALMQRLHIALNKYKTPDREALIAELKALNINPETGLLEAQLLRKA